MVKHWGGRVKYGPEQAVRFRPGSQLFNSEGNEVMWQAIETAPKDGTEIIGWRDDCGMLLIRWTCMAEFCTEKELAEVDDETQFQEDWFYADFTHGGRLEGREVPTLWMLPAPPDNG